MALRSHEFRGSGVEQLFFFFRKKGEQFLPDHFVNKPTHKLYTQFARELSAMSHLPEFRAVTGDDRLVEVSGQMLQGSRIFTDPQIASLYSLHWNNLEHGSFIYSGQLLAATYNPSLTFTRRPMLGVKAPYEQFYLRIIDNTVSVRDEQLFGIDTNQAVGNPFDFSVTFNNSTTLDRGRQLFYDFVHGV